MLRVYLKQMQKASTLIEYQEILAILLGHKLDSLEGSQSGERLFRAKEGSCRRDNTL